MLSATALALALPAAQCGWRPEALFRSSAVMARRWEHSPRREMVAVAIGSR